MRNIKVILSLLLCVVLTSAKAQQNKAVFIILDGIPADVIENTETPFLDEIAGKGGYTRAWLGGIKGGYSQSPTVSAVGYNHLITGTWSNKHNVHDNDIAVPNYHYWNIFRIAEKFNPALKTAIFSSWTDNRTKLIGESLQDAGNIRLDYVYDGLELDTVKFPHTEDRKFMFEIDEHVSREAARNILENAPDLSWVYLEFTDDMGHMYGDSPQLTDAVKKADVQVGRIWHAIRQREKTHKERWMIVVTTDHGRDSTTGKHHGGQSDRERTIWITTNAPSLNAHFNQTPAITDIAPSILRFMNIAVPETVKGEMDGISFIGKLSFSNLRAQRSGRNAVLTWNPQQSDEQLQVLVATTNHYKNGNTDRYEKIGKVNSSDAKYSFLLPPSPSGFYKILMKGKHNWMNVWLTTD